MDRDQYPYPTDDARLGRGMPQIEAYDTGVETVIFDGENPLAWIASSTALPLEQQT